MLPEQTDLSGLTALLNTQFAPHGEVQMGSSEDFGWAGDYDDPASANWLRALGALRDPNIVGGGEGADWVDPFVRNLWIKSGQTGAADAPNQEAIFKLQSQFANTLPNLANYQGLKASVGQGGDLWQKEQARLAEAQRWQQEQDAMYENMRMLQARQYAEPQVGGM